MSEKKDVGAMMKELAMLTRGGIKLDYRNGNFAVWADFGNSTRVVVGSVAKSAEESLNKTLERWHNRSEERPFY